MSQRVLKRPTKLVLDYDGTLTEKDTMAVLGDLAKQPKMSWDEIVNAYMRDYAIYKNTPYPWKNYDRGEFSAWLASRTWVEQNSARRVQDANFFRGATLKMVKQNVAKHLNSGTLRFRSGWSDLFDLFMNDYDPVDGTMLRSSIEILSVNWSGISIREALYQTAARSSGPRQELRCQYMNDIRIFANEIEGLASPKGSSGRVIRPFNSDIRTSADKLKHFNAIVDGLPRGTLTVYVGDSSTDFDCLCAADLGIWLFDVPETEYKNASQETFKPLKYTPPPLSLLSDISAASQELFYWTPGLHAVINAISHLP